MAENTITAIVPDIYEALDVVSRELTGMIPAVTMASSADRAGIDQNIVVPVAPAGNVSDNTPAMVVPDPTGQTIGSTTVQITKDRSAEFGFIGSDQKKMNTGPGYQSVRSNVIAQAIRAVVNEVETDLTGLYTTFSRAYGTAGTAPFSTANDYTDASQSLAILKDNGAPQSDNQLVIDTVAGANFIGKQSAVNAAGTDSMLRQGVLLDLAGMPLRESAQINQAVTVGAAASYLTDTGATYVVGTTTIHVDTGTGAALAGDVITFAGDTNKYVVTTGFAGDGDMDVIIAEPGLQQTLADGVAMTVVAAATRNLCFSRSALVLAARAPALPEEGDMAEDRMIITDPRSGLSMEFAMYKGYKKVRYEVGLAWGVKNVKPEHTSILLG